METAQVKKMWLNGGAGKKGGKRGKGNGGQERKDKEFQKSF